VADFTKKLVFPSMFLSKVTIYTIDRQQICAKMKRKGQVGKQFWRVATVFPTIFNRFAYFLGSLCLIVRQADVKKGE